MLKTRIITAVIGIPLLLLILYQGGLAWTALFVFLAAVALYEYWGMMKSNGHNPQYVSAGFLLLLLFFRQQAGEYFMPLLLAAVLLMVLETVILYPRFQLEDIALSWMGAFYTGFLFGFALLLQQAPQPFPTVLLVFLVTWGSDVGGYLFGRLWGKNKMTPLLSPNKTWVGAIGGMILAVAAAATFYYFYPLAGLSLAHFMVMALLGSVSAQLGDLFESAIKRYFGAKDSGSIIPGHGGVLDRFDSFLLVLPVFYYFIMFFR